MEVCSTKCIISSEASKELKKAYLCTRRNWIRTIFLHTIVVAITNHVVSISKAIPNHFVQGWTNLREGLANVEELGTRSVDNHILIYFRRIHNNLGIQLKVATINAFSLGYDEEVRIALVNWLNTLIPSLFELDIDGRRLIANIADTLERKRNWWFFTILKAFGLAALYLIKSTLFWVAIA